MPKVKAISQIAFSAGVVKHNIAVRKAELNIPNNAFIGEKLGLKRTAWNYYLRNPRRLRLEQLAILSQVLKVPLSWLVSDHSADTKEG